jgi:UDP-N-acetylmuramate: L-alanyl-gamma-D-glutamyl-meso-diaminopimelate ligase
MTKHFHLIGICGSAMAALAGMLQQRGHTVTGSDAAAYPPMSDFLTGLGIAVAPFSERNLQPTPDVIVVGNAISRGNVEVEFALDARLPLHSLPQVLHDEFLAGRETIVIAGTHGKTTTTAMLSWIIHACGHDPSFLVGGIAENFGSSFRLGGSPLWILEGDEYDTAFFDKGPKFLHYFPSSLILTSVEFDHADIYRNLDDVKTSFKRLVNLIPHRGSILAWDGGTNPALQANLDDCLSRAFSRVARYGFCKGSHWQIVNPRYESSRTLWSVSCDGQPWGEFEFSMAGEYNVLNATAAAAMAANCGISAPEIAAALRDFRSVKRRLEVRAEIGGTTIVDDFAHHPTAIAETLRALRTRYPGRRLWAILEPRSNTLARNFFQEDLARSLGIADRVVITSVYRAEKYSEWERLDVDVLAARLCSQNIPARHCADADAIVAEITPELRDGDVVAILSNGSFGGIYEKLPAALRTRFQRA